MKKHILLGGMLLCAAAFTSCNEDFDDWASPQSNEQGSDAAAYGITISTGSQANVVMDNAGEEVEIVAATANQEGIASIVLKSLTINGESLPFTNDNGVAKVQSAQLDSLVEAITLDRSATPHDVTVKTEWAAVLATGEAVSAEAETAVTVTPHSSTPQIDPKGYALLGDWQGWNPGSPTWMTEIEPGVYQAVVTTSGDSWFKFYQGTGFDAADFGWDDVAYGCAENGDASSPNLLVWADDPRFGGFETPMIGGAGQWLVTLDMNKLYYKYEPKETKYYVVGQIQGWSDSNRQFMFYAEGGNVYSYTTYWPDTQWNLKIWDQDGFGDWSTCWQAGANGATDQKGTLYHAPEPDGVDGSFGPHAGGGWYTLSINMSSREYEWTAIDEPATEYEAISLIGGFNDWGGDVDLVQLEGAPHNWYVRHTLDADTELKFRANHDWGVNWGSDGSDAISEDKYYVTPGDGNIIVPAGTYDFYLNDITGLWSIAKVAE